jgi:hypothetical protein
MRMRGMARLYATALTTAVLLVSGSLPASAQGVGGPCAFVSDDALAQALGPGVRGQNLPSGSGNSLCAIFGVTANPIAATHVANVAQPGSQVQPESLARLVQGAPQGVQAVPVTGVGDSGFFIAGSENGVQGAMLVVQSGADIYTFAMREAPDTAQDTLVAIAQAALATVAQ